MSYARAGAPRRATISDVAREAATGKTSVSRYLNGETNVLSLDLRERIEAAIKRLDYQPNQMARGLKRGRNRLIGMLVADLTNPYTVEVLQGVEFLLGEFKAVPFHIVIVGHPADRSFAALSADAGAIDDPF